MTDRKPLVSVLCPCYNSEKYVERMLDSILNQTYENIELICIDDGSMDRTADIIQKYVSIFESTGRNLFYIYRGHKGQAAAINAGLKVIHGDYFTLIDSDDFLDKTSIEKRAIALEENREYGVVVSDFYIVSENDLNKIIGRGNEWAGNLCFQPHQFFLTLTGYSTITPLGYMVRTENMRAINPQMEINECIEGQNYQILLPMYYYYKRLYLNEALGYYVIRNDSHSHMVRSKEQICQRNRNLLNMLEEIFSDMHIPAWKIQVYLKMSIFYKLLEEN